MYFKKQDQEPGSLDGAQTPPLARHMLPTSHSDGDRDIEEQHMEVEMGSIYEIDHTKLPPRTPVPLKSIRLVMVSAMTELNVSVRYPSIESLQRYFQNGLREMCPEMDQRFVIGTKLAEQVLFRRILSEEFVQKKHLEDFWLLICNSTSENFGDVISNKSGACLSELKSNGVLRWGARRQVKFIGRHRENKSQSSSIIVKVVNEKVAGNKEPEAEEDQEEEEEADDDDDEEAVTEETIETEKRPKRKCCVLKHAGKAKKAKSEKMITTKAKNYCRQIVVMKNQLSSRWSAERYKQAEKYLLEVMKAKSAVYGRPILRPELRAEARKKIGDTGLLDHLLKHMAGRVAPGDTDRFRRRHNAEGAMEYWLESADLLELRREAGVQDPYWTPHAGWELGDCITQDPVCAKELKQLKEETSKLKSDMKDMVSKKEMEEELAKVRMVSKKEMEEGLAKVRREIGELLLKNQHKESQAIVVSNPSANSQKLDLVASPTPLNYDSSFVNLEKYGEQLSILSEYVSRIEEDMVKLKSKVEEKTRSDLALMESTDSECITEKEKQKVEAKGQTVVVQPQLEMVDQREGKTTETQKAERTSTAGDGGGGGTAAAEKKAAKIERLKSGFRICKPQGTFLWPNMAINNPNMVSSSQVVVQFEDLVVVPTPPSASSSTASAPPQLPFHDHHPPSPVRPTAERRAFKVTVSSVGNNNFSATTTTTTSGSNKTTTWINLNDLPASNVEGFCGTPSSSRQTISTTSTVMPPVERRQSSSSAGSCSQKGVGTWLALATPTQANDGPTRG